jgi:hypothetical protein
MTQGLRYHFYIALKLINKKLTQNDLPFNSNVCMYHNFLKKQQKQ